MFFKSPITAIVRALLVGIPCSFVSFVEWNCVPFQVTYPSVPQRKIRVPKPIVRHSGSFNRGDNSPAVL